MSANKSLHAANKAKQDEFYTQLSDIEKELKYYRHHLHGKTIYCNCDDPMVSNDFLALSIGQIAGITLAVYVYSFHWFRINCSNE